MIAAGLTCLVAGDAQLSSTPLVLLPGEGGTAEQQFGFLLPLLARSRQVIAIDYPDTEESDGGTSTSALDGVRAAVDELLPGREVDVVGYSLGTTTAAELAAAGRARRLVLIAGWLQPSERQRLFAELWASSPEAARPALVAFAGVSSAALPDSRVRNRVARDMASAVRMAALGRKGLTELAPQIQVPTLVIGCAEDAIVPREQSRALFAAISDSRYAEVDSGHAVVHERPIELLQLIDDFLAEAAHASDVPAAGVRA